MKRRTFVKLLPLAAMAPGQLVAHGSAGENTGAPSPPSAGSQAGGGAQTGDVPDWAKHVLDSDMQGLGPDGKPTGQKATFTGASKANATAEEAAKKQMKLTAEEQAILDG